MLTLLRKIRRRLFAQAESDTVRKSLIDSSPTEAIAKEGGSARKYIFYAIGEIALVVIGIPRGAVRGTDCSSNQ